MTTRTVLIGRAEERKALDRLLEAARAGESRALVVRGEPGVGKTALLEHVVERATGFGVARAAGVQSEIELAFAGLHQLCAPMLDRLDRLPGPQHDALSTAYGLSTGAAPDRFLVGLAVLSLLSEVAEEKPILCVLDDAQWLDRSSAQALAFVARRVLAESVALVFAVRSPGEEQEFAGLPEVVVQGLGDSDASTLLGSAIAGPLDERVRERIIAETHGNPLALLELPRGLTPAELAGGFGLPGAEALPGRIEQSFLRRLEALPVDTPRLAPCPRGGRGRRGRRPGARTLGRQGARARWTGRGGRLPGAVGQFDGRPGAPVEASPRRGPGQARGGRARRCTGTARHRGGRTSRRAPARPSGAAARRDRVRGAAR